MLEHFIFKTYKQKLAQLVCLFSAFQFHLDENDKSLKRRDFSSLSSQPNDSHHDIK